MFIDEARLCARIRHANVVEIIDVVALDQELMLVMDYVPGESLARLIQMSSERGASIPERIALAISCDALHGLHAAHEARDERGAALGIVHRDVSPQNVLVGVDGTARLHDFGTAKGAGRIQQTRDGQVKGKLAYMSPEQLRGGMLDARSDVYAAGVVLWELLTGQRWVRAETKEAMLREVLTRPLPKLSQAAPNISEALETIVERALSREASQRFPTARDMAIALELAAPLARAREVGDWVTHLAAESLERRARMLAEIESGAITHAESFAEPGGPRREEDEVELPTRVRDEPA
jgi:serine/threonine-protein kinase